MKIGVDIGEGVDYSAKTIIKDGEIISVSTDKTNREGNDD